ncbi:MAG: hypothetical protein AAFY06_11255 [Pseudomonadota bacterium]
MSAVRHVLTVILCGFLLGACQEDGAVVSESETDAVPSLLAAEQRNCERRGGNWALTPSRNTFTCYLQTSDANQLCASSDDCSGQCLARSRTCAPITPLYGCHEILTSEGVRQTRCLE